MATSPPNLRKILSESQRIINAQPRNFFALSFLFLFPTSITALLYPTLQYYLFNGSDNQSELNTPTKILLPALACGLLNLVFSSCAFGSITYTTFHAFSGEAIKLKSAVKSISSSLFPLLGTALLVHTIVFVITFILSVLILSAIFGSSLFFGIRVELLFSPYFVVLVMALPIIVVMMYVQVNWFLASVVVVVESAWGFMALKRSKTLIKGKRRVASALCVIFVFSYVVLLWSNKYFSSTSLGGADLVGAEEWIKCLPLLLVLRVLITSGFLTLIQLYNVTATTVLYAYCKGIDHDRKDFAGEYVSLPTDDIEKASVV